MTGVPATFAAFSLALGSALILVPGARWAAFRAGVLDRPDRRLKKHREAIPYFGGVAIFLAIAVAVLIVKFGVHGTPRGIVGIMAGASVVFLLGLVDDVRPMGPYAKLLVQIVAAAIPVAFGVHIKFVENPWGSIPLTIFWIVGVTNAFNLLDIMDGLSAGIAVIAATCFWIISSETGRFNDAVIAASLCGACLGFLWYNRPPARIFMGDAGSLLIGYTLAAVAIGEGYSLRTELGVIAPLMILGIPIFETLFVMSVRWQAGKPVMRGSPDHIPLRLLKMGFSRGQTLAIMYGAGALLSGAALVVIRLNWERALLLSVAMGIAGFLVAIRLASVKMDS